MKKILIIAALFMSGISARAQIHVSFNIGTQPVWGPTGYDYARYYYIPDIDAYYDVSAQMYVYPEGRGWRHSRTLPGRYSNVDLYSMHKIVINDANPWMHHQQHVAQYASYRGRHDQTAIRDSREEKYYENPHHPMHNQWHGRGDNHNGNHGNDRDWHDNGNNNHNNNNNTNHGRSTWHDRGNSGHH